MRFFLRSFFFFSPLFLLVSCQNSSTSELPPEETSFFYKGADISFYPRIAQKNLTFKDRNNVPRDFLHILQESGVNTIRLRLWHTPADEHASFQEVLSFSNQLKALGFKIWLTVHYSDTWADPAHQAIPAAWQNASYEVLKDSVYNYTSKVMDRINPDIIQIGNEVDSGILLPVGNVNTNRSQFLGLLNEGIQAVRDHNSTAKIMIHKADPNTALWFFDLLKTLDFDFIGLSYYPQWHGKDLSQLNTILSQLETTFPQDIFIAETAYPFTLDWNDHTHNVLGSNDQIIFPEYPASLDGQKAFLSEIKSMVNSLSKGVGFGYWGAEWVAFEGPLATNGSSWENQALFDFNLRATPALEVFAED